MTIGWLRWFLRVGLSVLSLLLALSIAFIHNHYPDHHGFSSRIASRFPALPRFARPTAPHTVPLYLREYIDAAIETAILAQIGQRDHALEEGDTRIVFSLTSNDSTPSPSPNLDKHPARVIIRDNSHGGPCWMIASSQGQVGISLPYVVYPTSVTLDYVPPSDPAGRARAPRNVRLWGMLEGKTNVERYEFVRPFFPPVFLQHAGPAVTQGHPFLLLVDAEYQSAAKHVQTFPVYQHIQDAQLVFGLFVLEILNNWGDKHTCVHRVRIHGRAEADPLE
ncbi:hypothetical protein C8Q76DRAFT_606729 [Earliella scabrosa]|nr:hypothetical protein C8Q76DRAFT_606729 [Earliella scabrosa]